MDYEICRLVEKPQKSSNKASGPSTRNLFTISLVKATRKASLLRLDYQFFSLLTSAGRSLLIKDFTQDLGNATVLFEIEEKACHSTSSLEVQKQCSNSGEMSVLLAEWVRV